MNVNVTLDRGFKWFHKESVWVKGYLFDEAGQLYEDSTLAEYFSQIEDEKVFEGKIWAANGSFAVVINRPGLKVAAVDRLRSIPLFYAAEDSEVYVSDNANWLLEHTNDKTTDALASSEFLRTGYVIGANTLIPGIKQLQAGEYMSSKASGITTEFYYRHLHSSDLQLGEAEHFERLETISNNIFARLISSAHGKTLVIPLSGGYDSRYIAAMLKRLGYENVICYTYGRKDSFEVQISRKVAQSLNYPWHYIEYTAQAWEDYFKNEALDYTIFASNLCSLPHVQDFIAVKELTRRQLLPPDAIIVPGFCGDVLGGSYVPMILNEPEGEKRLLRKGIVNHVMQRHLYLENDIPQGHTAQLKTHIRQTLAEPCAQTVDEFISLNEAWCTEHRVAKFIVNALRPYEFFSYGWRMPLWDTELSDYWYRVPLSLRQRDKLYDRYLLKKVFAPYNIAFAKSPAPKITAKTILKEKFPGVFKLAKRLYWRFKAKESTQDINAVTHLLNHYYADLGEWGIKVNKLGDLNQVSVLWCLNVLEHHLAKSAKPS